MKRKRIRNHIFLRDVLSLALTAFGGPQAHVAMYLDLLVAQRGYLTEDELIELNALCQILPGPTSTQTITAIGFRVGGPKLAYLTLLIWALPAVTLMTVAAFLIAYFQHEEHLDLSFAKFIMPMAVGFVAYAGQKIGRKVVKTTECVILMILSAVVCYFYHSPYVFPAVLLVAGAFSSRNYRKEPIEEKTKINVEWANFGLWLGVLVGVALIGYFTQNLAVRIFENFYRNGSLIFGGGQVLVPLLYSEFVDLKKYLSSEEFLTGFSLVQAVPGPVFSFSSYIGALSMREHGTVGQLLGSLMAAGGIFLPGTFLIFFVIRFWDSLKRYRPVRSSLAGINAAASGMVIAAAFLLARPLNILAMPSDLDPVNIAVATGTFSALYFSRIPAPFIVLAGVLLGVFLA
ncbi:hypothetical protein FUAX_03040 [Fulvitalea axinellae]|uniref:Chromate transporter n=1 Tax=Fulvitalea axinellae TaxID=1182444 RepID=A0AAU9CJ33_9BACT|nr:hypothetical protein FUAX_03040 [Fulvitalea axinellae]